MNSPELVSIIVPCYNEEKTIGLLLEAIRRQTFPLDLLEVVLADGKSSDNTLVVAAEFQRHHPELKITVIQNERRIIPAALNLAIQSSLGEYIIRLDAHSVPDEHYVQRCVENLKAGKGDNVGGVWQIKPGAKGWMAQSIAAAAGHPLGAGDARYRYSSTPGEVDTVPFGAYHRSLFERVGLYDETLRVNEDYELNARIRKNGGKIFFDPAIKVDYFARPRLTDLVRQYFRYGFWKWRMLKRYPGTLRWRQALPPVLVLGTLSLFVFSIWYPLAAWLLAAGMVTYLSILVYAAISPAKRYNTLPILLGFPLAIAAMHYSWGTGFLVSILNGRK